MSAPVQLTDVHKIYGTGPSAVTALAGVTYGFEAGTFTAVMGPVRLRQEHCCTAPPVSTPPPLVTWSLPVRHCAALTRPH